jgi:hypothetical protein
MELRGYLWVAGHIFWVVRAQVPKTAGKENMNHLDVLTRSTG